MIAETGTLPGPVPMFELVSIESYIARRLKLGRVRVVDGMTWCSGCGRAVDRGWQHGHNCPAAVDVEKLLAIGPPRPGWPEDFRVPHFPTMQGCA